MKSRGIISLLAVSFLSGWSRLASAATFGDVTNWVGTGSNEAAVIIDWNDGTTEHSEMWGYHWNGDATGEQMLDAIVAADPHLYIEISSPSLSSFGTALFGIGYDANGDGTLPTTPTLAFTNQIAVLADYSDVDDSRAAVSSTDKWAEGWFTGYWAYFLSTDSRLAADATDWDYSGVGMTGRVLSDGDWDGWSFAPGFDATVPTASLPVPEPASIALLGVGGVLLTGRRRRIAGAVMGVASAAATLGATAAQAYVYNPTDFATSVASYTGPADSRAAYNDPTAVLGQPPLTFNNSTNPNVQDIHLSKIVEPPFNYSAGTTATRQTLLTVLPVASGGTSSSLTVQMGKPVTDDPSHPYGDDLIVFGNSFFTGSVPGSSGFVDDSSNLNNFKVGGVYSHPVSVSVSPDDVHWFTFPTLSGILPYNAYQWNAASASWSTNELDPTMPVSPTVLNENFAGQSAAAVLAAYGNSAGGTPLDLENAVDANGNTLAQDGYDSILYVRFTSTSSDYAVISGVSAVSDVPEPASVGVLVVGAVGLVARRRK